MRGLGAVTKGEVFGAEEIRESGRADAEKPNMGLTSWSGDRPRKRDVSIAKNYLDEAESNQESRINWGRILNHECCSLIRIGESGSPEAQRTPTRQRSFHCPYLPSAMRTRPAFAKRRKNTGPL